MAVREFSGEPGTIWETESGPDRTMTLLEDFWFRDSRGRVWTASKGSGIDGASIPKPLWSLVGSPYTGDYRRASIVHDVACVIAGDDQSARRAADRMFFEACREGGCNRREAIILYIGVRIGAWWSRRPELAEDRVRLHADPVDEQVRQDFQALGEIVLGDGETDDPSIVEQRTDIALHASRNARQHGPRRCSALPERMVKEANPACSKGTR